MDVYLDELLKQRAFEVEKLLEEALDHGAWPTRIVHREPVTKAVDLANATGEPFIALTSTVWGDAPEDGHRMPAHWQFWQHQGKRQVSASVTVQARLA